MPWSNLSVLTSFFRDFEKHYCVLDTDLNPAGVVIKKPRMNLLVQLCMCTYS